MMRSLMICVALGLLMGCSPDESLWRAAPQQWQELSLSVETRPEQIKPGMNEFLVIAGHQQRGFINNLLVEVRTSTGSIWKQAMPDGALGVFRTALPVADVVHGHLYVRLTRKGQQGKLTFPLSAAGAQ